MAKIAFVACSKTKADQPAPAAALYISPLFRKSLLAALDACDEVYILSAKHGVLSLGEIVAPYDMTLKTMRTNAKIAWGEAVAKQLGTLVNCRDEISLYCGNEYIRPLRSHLEEIGCRINEPLHGLSIGPRLSRLRILNEEAFLEKLSTRLEFLVRVLWRAQGKGLRLAECSGQTGLPRKGVYLILSGARSHADEPHIVRVGTHAVSRGSKTTLWNRLSTHRGTNDGRGSHRSSIFRSHVGRALINRQPSPSWPGSWGQGQQAPADIRAVEVELEREVSRHIGDMKLIWLTILDESSASSDRSYIERNLIGLLSRVGLLSGGQSAGWLGLYSHDWRIAASGLWNLDHIFLKPDPHFLDIIERYIAITLGKEPAPMGSLAPLGWRERNKKTTDSQLNLFADGAEPDG